MVYVLFSFVAFSLFFLLLCKEKLLCKKATSLIFLIVIISTSLYHYLGATNKLNERYIIEEIQQYEKDFINNISSGITLEKEQVKKELEQLEFLARDCSSCYYQLSKMYHNTGAYQRALLFAKLAYKSRQDNRLYLIHYTGLIVEQGNVLSDKQRHSLKQILSEDAGNILVLNNLALDAYQSMEYVSAVGYWRSCVSIIKDLPEYNKLKNTIQIAIRKAEEKITNGERQKAK